jgi:hypothetical protein
MNWEQNKSREDTQMDMGSDPELAQALGHFKASMDAWSVAAYSRPRDAKSAVRHSWRMVAAWALGCLLAAGSLAAAGHEIYRRQEMAKQAAEKAAEQRAAAGRVTAQPANVQPVGILPVGAQSDKKTPAVTTRKASSTMDSAMDSAEAQDEDLLATVDSDVSRQVPAAMEPLAQMMDENGAQ